MEAPPEKTRKPLSEESLQKLKLAREKAAKIRAQNKVKRLEEKTSLAKSKLIEETNEVKEEVKNEEPKKEEVKEEEVKNEVENEEPEEEEEQPKIIRKKNKKYKPVIIVEQSSEDDDEFEANDKVLFVKRVSKKKDSTPQLQPQPPPHPHPPPPPKPVKHQPTLLEQQYNAMFSGQFLNNRRRF